jgi:hypothetical protein
MRFTLTILLLMIFLSCSNVIKTKKTYYITFSEYTTSNNLFNNKVDTLHSTRRDTVFVYNDTEAHAEAYNKVWMRNTYAEKFNKEAREGLVSMVTAYKVNDEKYNPIPDCLSDSSKNAIKLSVLKFNQLIDSEDREYDLRDTFNKIK